MSASVNVLTHRPSLLDRRASSNFPATPDHLSVSDLVPHHPQPSATSATSLLSRGNPRRPSAAGLAFVPLTPIMASPLLTPEVAHASSPAALFDTVARQSFPGHPPSEDDYVTHHPSSSNPTWTTSPPTPPPKNTSSLRLAPSTPSSPARGTRRSSRSRNGAVASRTNSRPISIAYFTPSSLSQSYSASSSSAVPSGPAYLDHVPARRMSLPSDLSKPLPPRPGAQPDGALKDLPPIPVRSLRCLPAPIDSDNEESLLPSLSRSALKIHKRAASLGSNSGETRTLRGSGRKLFDLEAPEGDLSEEEDASELGGYKGGRRRTQEEHDREREMGQIRVREQEQDKAEQLRRYHALMELLTTEVGYLLDLRALVTVYLDQLVRLSDPSTTPSLAAPASLPTPPLAPPLCLGILPPPSRTMSTFAALSIPSFFPSSRSSNLQISPSPSPSSSAAESLSAVGSDGRPRERQQSGGSIHTDSAVREREKDVLERVLPLKSSKPHTPGPVLMEREVRVVCRNAQQLLNFHERFVVELRDAVSLMGFRDAFSQPGREQPGQMSGGEEKGMETVECAVELVVAKFVNEAASFSIYETFCPGHVVATDLVRRAQERSPSAWDAYEQRCALLVSHTSLDHRLGQSRGEPEPDLSSSTHAPYELDAPSREPTASLRKRRHSTPTLSFVFPASGPIKDRGELPVPTVTPHSATSPLPPADSRTRGNGHRLRFMDYLIKPVQRLCKYPLLLDQLRHMRRKRNTSGPLAPVVGSEAIDGVVQAAEAMRRVVGRVNHASEKEAHNLRSALIASRIAFSPGLPHGLASLPSSSAQSPQGTPSSSEGTTSSHGHSNSVSSCSGVSTAPTSPGACCPTLPSSPSKPRATSLTADFVSSLGPCLLAGALDVVHHPAHRARYLGVFLYAGGYCIIVKITKNGKVYEPRHWFALSEVEVHDIEDDNVSFPYSFSISGCGHHLQLASACAREKAIWLSAIERARPGQATWRNEPLSSFQADDKSPPVLSVPLVDEPQEMSSGLATIQSLSELEKHSDGNYEFSSHAPSPAILKYSKTLSRIDGITLKQDYNQQHAATISAPLSRRSSTASVKAFFSPMTLDSSRITRPSSTHRSQIEHVLHDVLSENCLTARSQAQMRGEELFQVRVPLSGGGRKQSTGMSRSNSGISIMGLGAAKRKYDIVVRRNRSVDLDMPVPPLPPLPADVGAPIEAIAGGSTGRAKSLAVRRHKKQPASIAPAISTAIAQMNAESGEETSGDIVCSPEALSSDSPPDTSRRSPASSILPSPIETAPLPIPMPGGGGGGGPGVSPNGTLRQSDVSPGSSKDARPKRTRSMVENVRFFFQQPKSESFSSSEADRASPTPPLGVDSPPADYSTGIVQWLRRTSIRRRPGSSSPSSASIEDQALDPRRPLPTRNSTDGVGMTTSLDASPTSRRRSGLHSVDPSPKRHRSLFVSSSSSRSRDRLSFLTDDSPLEDGALPTTPTRSSSSLSAKKSLKNLLLFQRTNALTPVDTRR